jgi:hypothetical protein
LEFNLWPATAAAAGREIESEIEVISISPSDDGKHIFLLSLTT